MIHVRPASMFQGPASNYVTARERQSRPTQCNNPQGGEGCITRDQESWGRGERKGTEETKTDDVLWN